MKLYGHPISNHSLRVQALMEEFEIPYDFQVINFDEQENCKPAYLKINPNGMVPVIDDNGYTLWESHAIMRYLSEREERYDWYPKPYKERIEVEKWLDWLHTRLNPESVAIAFNTFRNPQGGEEKIGAAKAKLAVILPIIEAVFNKQSYLCGSAITIADFSLLSSLLYLNMCNAGLEQYPETKAWYDTNSKRASIAKVFPSPAEG